MTVVDSEGKQKALSLLQVTLEFVHLLLERNVRNIGNKGIR